MSDFYKEFDDLFHGIVNFLNNYGRSKIMQDYFVEVFNSLFYANLINHFFTNLNKDNVKELNLPRGKIGKIKNRYKEIRKDTRLALSLRSNNINVKYYEDFKNRISRDYPEFQIISLEIEKKVGFSELQKNINEKSAEIKKLGKLEVSINDIFITNIMELLIDKREYFPIGKNLDKMIKVIIDSVIPEFSEEVIKTLNQKSKEMIDNQRVIQEEFEYVLYKTWEEPLDLLEAVIKISLEAGEIQRLKSSKVVNADNRYIHEALIQIHARALQISNEILVLLKSGYADGANSRWRTLHELTVISIFLCDNSNEVSQRYLDHHIIRTFKEARDYRKYYKKLGYPPIDRKEFNMIKKEKEKLCKKYDDRFQDDYGWMPSSILSNRNFRALEDHVKLNALRPFYNLASNSVHGGVKGFFRLGLTPGQQEKILLVGPTNYGLADPIQNTVISLRNITLCLLMLEPDFENIITGQILLKYPRNIGEKAVSIQRAIEDIEIEYIDE